MLSSISGRMVPIAVTMATFAAVGLGVFSASPALAAQSGSTGLLVGSKILPGGAVTTATENPDGSRLVLHTESSGGWDQGGGATWSPDGRTIAFTNGAPALETYLLNGTGGTGVADGVDDPVYTPDGSTIIGAVVQCCDWSTFQLDSLPADWDPSQHPGTQAPLVPWFSTPTNGSDRFPSVSPSGTVYFQHTVGNATDIWSDHGTRTPGLVIADGSEPDVSPDGSQIAFVRKVGAYEQIFTQSADGSGTAKQVTSGAANHNDPRWTPDGLGLDYDANPGTNYLDTVGHHLVLASHSDTVIPNGLIGVTQQPTTPAQFGLASTFHSTGPVRLLDTRDGTGLAAKATGAVPSGGTVPLLVDGASGLPKSGISAVVMNLTVTQGTQAGYLTAYPEGTAAPSSSNLNWTKGETIANQIVVPVGSDGEVDLANHSAGSAQVIADISGYFTADSSGAGFTATGPTRILDTRGAIGVPTKTAVPVNGSVPLQVAGSDGLPAEGVSAVVLNVTATDTRSSGYLTAYPDGAASPEASNLNWNAGETIANHVVVPVGADGRIDLSTHDSGTADIVADVFGYFTAGGGAAFHSTAPTRLLGLAGTVVPADATAVVLNVTATDTRTAGFLTVWPNGAKQPTASNLNWTAGETIPNLVTVPVLNGKIDFSNHSSGTVDVVADVFGYYGG
jgi:hypothetical protein